MEDIWFDSFNALLREYEQMTRSEPEENRRVRKLMDKHDIKIVR